jgi:uncharacterized damage-inducible protein DinB
MEDRERQLVVDQLNTSQERQMELVHGLTAEQWTFRPGEGRWSINECLEHVMRVEDRIFGLIGKKLRESAPEPEKQDPTHQKDSLVARSLPDRTHRREAPEPVRPIGQWADADELIAEFRKTRQRTTEFAATTQGDLRNHFLPHMALGELDCYQWLLVLSLHGARHAQQIEEIKAAPGFPRAIASLPFASSPSA